VGAEFERRRLRVYVAGPISSDPMVGVARANAASRQMFLDGLAPFVPHWDSSWLLGEGHWEAYLEFDLEFVSVCDAVYRLVGSSRGADKEVAIAETLGIPVFYELREGYLGMGYTQLLEYAKVKRLTGVKGQC
jgi:hypothetical protein